MVNRALFIVAGLLGIVICLVYLAIAVLLVGNPFTAAAPEPTAVVTETPTARPTYTATPTRPRATNTPYTTPTPPPTQTPLPTATATPTRTRTPVPAAGLVAASSCPIPVGRRHRRLAQLRLDRGLRRRARIQRPAPQRHPDSRLANGGRGLYLEVRHRNHRCGRQLQHRSLGWRQGRPVLRAGDPERRCQLGHARIRFQRGCVNGLQKFRMNWRRTS